MSTRNDFVVGQIILAITLGGLLAGAAVVAKPGAASREPVLTLIKQFPKPVLTVNSPGAEGIKYGFEGGRVIKLGHTYHLFTTELVGDPNSVKTKMAHWASQDRLHWKRISTLFSSSGNFTGADPRAALWAPMPVYDKSEGRWNLFYVAYRAKPNTKTAWYANYDGTIWRAVSEVKGLGGIGGPYKDVGIILQPGKGSDPWEGLQGTDSFFPYPVGGAWYGFYGSAHTEKLPVTSWQVGLARAPRLAGPWTRCSALNPVNIEKIFIENPIVTKLEDGTYVAVYDDDGDVPNAIGYTFSSDGIHWGLGRALVVQPRGKGFWADVVRTPLGLVPKGHNTFTLFYTGAVRNFERRFSPKEPVVARSIGYVTVKVSRPQ